MRLKFFTYIILILNLTLRAQATYTAQNIQVLSQITTKFDPRFNVYHQTAKNKDYIFYGNIYSIQIADISDPFYPKLLDSISDSYSQGALQPIYIQNNKLYYYNELGLLDIYTLDYLPDSLHKIGWSYSFSFSFSNLVFSGNNIYKNFGYDISLIDISNLANPFIKHSLTSDITGLGTCKSLNIYNDTLYASYGAKGLYVIVYQNNKFKLIDSIPHFFSSLVSNYANCISANKKTICNFYTPTTLDSKFYTKNNNQKFEFASSSMLLPSNYTNTASFIGNDWLVVSNFHDGLNIYDVRDLNNIKQTGSFNSYSPSLGQNGLGLANFFSGLPSGIIVVQDRSKGIFILDPKNAMPANIPVIIAPTLNYYLSVFPNPCDEGFNLQLKRDYASKVTLYNLFGVSVLQREYTSNINDLISTKNIQEGSYILKIDGNEGQLTQKIIVKH